MNHDVVILMPVYNEEQVVGDVARRVLERYPNLVCVNDGSSDDSATQIRATGATLINHPINLGQGAALQTALEYARGLTHIKYFVTYDADGQHRLEDVDRMVAELRRGHIDVVIGSRFLGRSTQVGPLKRVVLKLATVFGNLSSGTHLTDAHNGLRAFNRAFATMLNITMADMSHASEITVILGRSGVRYQELPVTIDYTDYSRAKGQSLWNAVNIMFDLFFSYFLRGKK